MDIFTGPERMLFSGIIVAGAVQLLKMWIPFVNGWGAAFANAVITAVALFVVFRFDLTWNTLALYFAIGLIASGIHGAVTKISDYPSPRENPTPSGTPAQNYSHMTEL
jgi:uncharacterized membrane protein HdeD (DUF308 family)